MTLLFDSSTYALDILDAVHELSWQQSQAILGDRWRVYLNQLSFQTVLPWLQEKYGAEVTESPPISCPERWELVNGSAITLGKTRLILVPSDAIDRQEFRVPQEWIDIPDWVGDYYLAVEVDPDDGGVTIWGYTTHTVLKTIGIYDQDDRAYCLEADALIADLNVLWVMHQLTTEPTRVTVPALPTLNSLQVNRLIHQIADAAIRLPRVEIPFPEWGALLERHLQQLYQHRQDALRASISLQGAERTQPANLSRWLQNAFEQGWQAIEDLLNINETPALAFSLRRDDTPETTVRRVKRVALTATVSVLLLVLLEPETDGRIAVRVRVLPQVGSTDLPANLSLSLLAPTGEVLQSVQARSQDNSMQLRRFRCPVGTPFRLQLAIADATVSEDFVS